jgi:predicted Zn-dependent protease
MLWFEAARDAYQVGDVFVSVRLVEVAAKLEQTGEVWAYKAKCNQHVGRLDEALDASRKALQLDPRHKWRAFTHVGILVSTGTLKNATEAVALADAMSLQHPAQLGKVGRFWWTMARANTIAGNKAAATTCVQTARSITKQ